VLLSTKGVLKQLKVRQKSSKIAGKRLKSVQNGEKVQQPFFFRLLLKEEGVLNRMEVQLALGT